MKAKKQALSVLISSDFFPAVEKVDGAKVSLFQTVVPVFCIKPPAAAESIPHVFIIPKEWLTFGIYAVSYRLRLSYFVYLSLLHQLGSFGQTAYEYYTAPT